jgi:thiosulfate/3-mercaptopyruvate sulfurtransferase
MPGSTVTGIGWQISLLKAIRDNVEKRMISIKSDSCKAERKGFSAIVKSMLIYGIVSILLHGLVLSTPALAGTETGEFCPTCPDWTDMDGWQAKKAAYDQDQQNIRLLVQQVVPETQNADPAPIQNTTTQNADPAPIQNTNASVQSNYSQAWTGRFAEVLASPMEVSPEEVVLDISPGATRFIEGAVNVNYEGFMGEGGKFKSASEMAKLLGDAGISRNDSLVIAGECLPCGGGPSPAIFSYWLLKYLGHEKVRVLDGSIDDWAAAGLNTSNKSAIKPKTNYIPLIKPELLAAFDYVVNGGAQIVDARSAVNYGMGSIPGAVNIPYENVIEEERIRPEEDLQKIFMGLEKERPVVVYTNVGVEASLVWFALFLSGYDSRLYSWRDWIENQPKFRFELADAEATPNPVRSGSTTTIAVSFRETQTADAGNSSQNGETRLTVKGCATCGFEGFALGTSGATGASGNNSGIVQLSSSGRTSQAGGVQAVDSALRCTAIINSPDGSEAVRTSLLATSGYKYMGIWTANVAPGVYKVSILATASGSTKTFADVLEIEVIG